MFVFAARINSGHSENTGGGDLRSSETPQYDALNFRTATEGRQPSGAYATIPDEALSQRLSETPQYDGITSATALEAHETGAYVTILDEALPPSSTNSNEHSDSAIKRTEFADKLASMTDEDFRRQFKVTDHGM